MPMLLQIMGNGEAVSRVDFNASKSIYFFITLGLALLPVLAQLVFPKALWFISNTIANPRKKQESFDQGYSSATIWVYIIMLLFSWLTIGIWLFSAQSSNQNINAVSSIVMVMLLTVLLFTFNSFLSRLMLRAKGISTLQTADQLSFFVLLGMLAYIVLIFQWFASNQVYQFTLTSVAIITSLWMLVRFIRLLFILPMQFGKSIVFIFFYLCAVEISPYILFGRIIINLN
ncbi:MAG: DUF4271 domain-containing protein [Bacteroidetes bacterium]|nr:DUF4271 domain-containing protein [Bacteroidota bacterium]